MIAQLVNLLIYVLVLGLIAWLVFYVVQNLPLPEPFGRVAKVIVMVVFVLILVLLLLQFIGVGTGLDLPRVTAR